jgi:hypothetical protein
MIKITIATDEFYPFHIPDLYNDLAPKIKIKKVYEVPDDFLDRWRKVMNDFYSFQKELEDLSDFK